MRIIYFFLAEKRKKLGKVVSPLQDESAGENADMEDNEDYMDDNMRALDQEASGRIKLAISEHVTETEIVPNDSG